MGTTPGNTSFPLSNVGYVSLCRHWTFAQHSLYTTHLFLPSPAHHLLTYWKSLTGHSQGQKERWFCCATNFASLIATSVHPNLKRIYHLVFIFVKGLMKPLNCFEGGRDTKYSTGNKRSIWDVTSWYMWYNYCNSASIGETNESSEKVSKTGIFFRQKQVFLLYMSFWTKKKSS